VVVSWDRGIVRTLVSFLLPGALGASAAALDFSLGLSASGVIFCRLSSLAGGGGGGAPFCTCWSFGSSESFVLLSFESSSGFSSVSCSLGLGSDDDDANTKYIQIFHFSIQQTLD
jgi:hypothetical protein